MQKEYKNLFIVSKQFEERNSKDVTEFNPDEPQHEPQSHDMNKKLPKASPASSADGITATSNRTAAAMIRF